MAAHMSEELGLQHPVTFSWPLSFYLFLFLKDLASSVCAIVFMDTVSGALGLEEEITSPGR